MKRLLLLIASFFLAAGLVAAQENHGATVSFPASTSAAGCLSTSTPPCTFKYLLFEGSGPGLENIATPFATITTGLSYVDDGATMNSYLGTTRCYVVQFQTTTGALVLTSPNSNEACATWGSQPATVNGLVLAIH